MYERQIYQIAESNRNFFLPELECSTSRPCTPVCVMSMPPYEKVKDVISHTEGRRHGAHLTVTGDHSGHRYRSSIKQSVTHGRCDAKPTVTFPAKQSLSLLLIDNCFPTEGRRLSWPHTGQFTHGHPSQYQQEAQIKYPRDNRHLLAVPRFRLNTYGRRAFSVAGPVAWNSLPDFIRDQTSTIDCFRRLKRTCSHVTSASSALQVLNDYALYTSTHSLTPCDALLYQLISY